MAMAARAHELVRRAGTGSARAEPEEADHRCEVREVGVTALAHRFDRLLSELACVGQPALM